MARDHFVPAALLGRFSSETTGPARERHVHVVRQGQRRPRRSRADAIGYTNGLYDVDFDSSLSANGPRFVDQLWSDYEGGLGRALDELIEGECSLGVWLTTVVPFVGSLLVRDRWFSQRIVESSSEALSEGDPLLEVVRSRSNLNLNRIVQRNGMIGRLLVSEWGLAEVDGELITSDLGYAYGIDQLDRHGQQQDRVFLMVPLSPEIVLTVTPQPDVRVLDWEEGIWRREMITFEPRAINAQDVNASVAKCSQDFIVGSEDAVSRIDPAIVGSSRPADLQRLQDYWPYRIGTRDLAGLWAALRLVTNTMRPSDVERMHLDPRVGIVDRLDPSVTTFVVGESGRTRTVGDVLSVTASGLSFTW